MTTKYEIIRRCQKLLFQCDYYLARHECRGSIHGTYDTLAGKKLLDANPYLTRGPSYRTF